MQMKETPFYRPRKKNVGKNESGNLNSSFEDVVLRCQIQRYYANA